MLSGVCRICGCTDSRACLVPAGEGRFDSCEWADEAETLCTACLPQAPGETIIELATQEMAAMESAGLNLVLPLSGVEAVSLVSLLQLAARHPEAARCSPRVIERGRAIIAALAEFFAVAPAVSELLRRGDDPAHDT